MEDHKSSVGKASLRELAAAAARFAALRAVPALAGALRSKSGTMVCPMQRQVNMGEFPSGQRGQTVNLLR